jgi:hypothetical protein
LWTRTGRLPGVVTSLGHRVTVMAKPVLVLVDDEGSVTIRLVHDYLAVP